MGVLNKLEPVLVWNYFEDICRIPRISKHEEKIRQYLLKFAIENHLETKEDNIGNILIIRPAPAGYENKKTVVLQSHMDMVGEKNKDYSHNWFTDPIIPQITNGWVSAKHTTLGADDGMGIASQMAILTDKNLRSGRIECLFTVDEESGMTGAINLKPDFFEGRILINLDSEDEGVLYIGCAGGMITTGILKYIPLNTGFNKRAIGISISDLHGGHSGDEIHKGYGNAIKIMANLLFNLSERYSFSLSLFEGGNLGNAIPREAFAIVVVDNDLIDNVILTLNELSIKILNEYSSIERDFKIIVKETDLPKTIIDADTQKNMINALLSCPHGVIAWSREMENLVETSTNLASVKFTGPDKIQIVTTQRSSVELSKREVAGNVESCLKVAGAMVNKSDGYPGWQPDINSEILAITVSSYKRIFGKEPGVRAIHAGLECGLIYEKFNGIDMISFGPTILGAHTTEERIDIKTVQKFWNLLLEVLKNIPDKS